MKDKEMAKEYTSQFGFGSDCKKITSQDANEAITQAFFVGLREGRREKWHDLRKDPNDLPKATTPVLVILESGVPYVSWISSDKGWWFCTNYYTGEDKVIAWCEVPIFNSEEENIKPKKCKNCEGTGFVPLGEGIKGIKKCPFCDGTGEIGTEKENG